MNIITRIASALRATHEAPSQLTRVPPRPPMADYTYGCERHFYEDCPNCGQGAAPLKFPEIDPSLLPAKEQA